VNTKHAREIIQADSFKWMMEWYLANFALAQAMIMGLSLAPTILLPWIFRRVPNSSAATP